MFYYYVVPIYLTGVFIASYFLVRILLCMFDFFNFFWDWWDDQKRVLPFIGYAEFFVLAGFVYYIIRWELSGTP